jgi:hypothetical protein
VLGLEPGFYLFQMQLGLLQFLLDPLFPLLLLLLHTLAFLSTWDILGHHGCVLNTDRFCSIHSVNAAYVVVPKVAFAAQCLAPCTPNVFVSEYKLYAGLAVLSTPVCVSLSMQLLSEVRAFNLRTTGSLKTGDESARFSSSQHIQSKQQRGCSILKGIASDLPWDIMYNGDAIASRLATQPANFCIQGCNAPWQ